MPKEPKDRVTELQPQAAPTWNSMSPGEKMAWLLGQALDCKREILTMPLPDPDDMSPASHRTRALALAAADSTIDQNHALADKPTRPSRRRWHRGRGTAARGDGRDRADDGQAAQPELGQSPRSPVDQIENVGRLAWRQIAIGNRFQDCRARRWLVFRHSILGKSKELERRTGAILSRMIFAAVMSPLRAAVRTASTIFSASSCMSLSASSVVLCGARPLASRLDCRTALFETGVPDLRLYFQSWPRQPFQMRQGSVCSFPAS
jgi:hypothetical protein